MKVRPAVSVIPDVCLTFCRREHMFTFFQSGNRHNRHVGTAIQTAKSAGARHVNSYTDAQEHLRSNRKHLRIHADLSCEVGQPGGKLCSTQILDISIGGLKFSCSHEIVNYLIPEGERTVGLIMDVEIDVQFKLPSKTTRTTAIKTGARIVHSERLAQDLFHVGIQFSTLNLNALRQLEAYIEGLEQ